MRREDYLALLICFHDGTCKRREILSVRQAFKGWLDQVAVEERRNSVSLELDTAFRDRVLTRFQQSIRNEDIPITGR